VGFVGRKNFCTGGRGEFAAAFDLGKLGLDFVGGHFAAAERFFNALKSSGAIITVAAVARGTR